MSSQPRVRHNSYDQLTVPDLDAWQPTLGVSVVIPAYGNQTKLDLTLASLAAQTYPEHLLEVVVVDDNSSPPLRLPDIRPTNTRLVVAPADAWGSAHAVNVGVAAASHEVILRLDADMVVSRHHVEAHARWHHSANYLVVLGKLVFADYDETALDAKDVYRAVADSRPAELFDPERLQPNWVDSVYEQSNYLLKPGARPFRVGDGACISFPRALHREVGGLDTSMPLGSDTEFSYRLAQVGAVFVPEMQAESWHLGLSQLKSDNQRGRRFRTPYVAHRIALARDRRGEPGLRYEIPLVDVIIDAREGTYEQVKASVCSVLTSTLQEVTVTLVGPWDTLPTGRRPLLEDNDLVLLHETFRGDSRVRLVTTTPADSYPAPFSLRLPAILALTHGGLRRLIDETEKNQWGLVLLPYPQDALLPIARLERTEALARARRLCRPGEDLEDVVHEIYGVHWLLGSTYALVKAADAQPVPSVSSLVSDLAKYKDLAQKHEAALKRAKADVEKWRKEATIPIEERIKRGLKRRALKLLQPGGKDGK